MTTTSCCPRCGAEPRDAARFCDSCGASLAVEAEPAEYKQVTVLFADVVRSMDIAAVLGPERLREVMADLVNRAAAVVQRFGGTLNQFTGDGIMALFGVPRALEDHARRACLAALDIQAEASGLASEVARRDGIAFELRVGLNSGEVVAGEIGSAAIGYTAIGRHVGLAQRMESVCPPGGVMLSHSTARLVEDEFSLSEPEFVHIKNTDAAVPARRLLAVSTERRSGRGEVRLVGRETETRTIAEMLDRSLAGRGAVITLMGPPGVGKSRLARETARTAARRGFAVFSTYCESHTREIPFNVVSRLLRSVFGIGEMTPERARARVRAQMSGAVAEDAPLLDDLLGVGNADVPLPDISPDARRRRLVDLINSVVTARPSPALHIIEDVHWIDTVSETMLAEFAAAIERTRAMMLITYRPEYVGALASHDGSTIVIEPLSDSHIGDLIGELLGVDPSVRRLSEVVLDRAGGIPFFAEEIVRDLAERGEIDGDRGAYLCTRPIDDIQVPSTLQATIGARIDRLNSRAKRTLNAAAVIGARFRSDLLNGLVTDAEVAPLVEAELVDVVMRSPQTEYAFRHPLIQKVAYESQLKSARSALHRRVASALEQTPQDLTGEEAAFIATQYDAAGDLRDAFEWHMRAATWYGARDIRAARGSWRLARRVADQLSDEDPDQLAMRIAPRALLCGSTFQVGGTPSDTGFEELRDLTTIAGDERSLALGMAGHLATLAFNSHYREAAEMASEFAVLLDSLGDPAMSVGLLWSAAQAKWEAGETTESLRLAQRIIDLAGGDLTMGDIVIASPLACAIMVKAVSKISLGRSGWRRDLEEGAAIAQSLNPSTRALAQLYKCVTATMTGALLPDADDVRLARETLANSERDGDESSVAYSLLALAVTMRYSPSEYGAALDLLARAREMIVRERLTETLVRACDIEIASEKARSGDLDEAIEIARTVLDEQFDAGEMVFRGPATTVLVETLLRRGSVADLQAARAAVDRLAAVPTEPGFAVHALPVLRLSALLAQADGDRSGYQHFVAQFRAKAQEADFEGCIAQAEAMV